MSAKVNEYAELSIDAIKKNLELLNKERVCRSAHGISSICQLLGVIRRHQTGEVPIEDAAFLGVSGGFISGGLESAIMELCTTIVSLTEPELWEQN